MRGASTASSAALGVEKRLASWQEHCSGSDVRKALAPDEEVKGRPNLMCRHRLKSATANKRDLYKRAAVGRSKSVKTLASWRTILPLPSSHPLPSNQTWRYTTRTLSARPLPDSHPVPALIRERAPSPKASPYKVVIRLQCSRHSFTQHRL